MSLVSIPYITLTAILFFLYLCEQKKIVCLSVKYSQWIAYTILWIYVGLRGHVMSDFISYYPFFNEYPDIFHLSYNNLVNGFEPGFNIYTAIIRTFTDNYFVWVAINTLIDFSVLAWFFRKYCYSIILPLIFFIAFNGILIEFNLYRNVKSIDLFLLSIPSLLSRNWIRYFTLNIIGVTFHSSAAIYLIMYFILAHKMSKCLVWSGFLISNLIFLFNISIVGDLINQVTFIQNLEVYDKLAGYSDNKEEYKISIGYIERTIGFLIFFCYKKKLIGQQKSNEIFLYCYWVYYVFFLIFYEVSVFVERIPILFIFSYWILYPNVIALKSKNRSLILTFICILVILKILMSYSGVNSTYQNIIFEKPNFQERKELMEISNKLR